MKEDGYMKKFMTLVILLGLGVLTSCGNNTSTKTSTTVVESTASTTSDDDDVLTGINTVNLDYDSFKESYGDASLTLDGEVLEEVDGVYTINVAESKQELTLSGYFEGRIVIQNGNSLDTYKGITLNLSNAFIVNDDEATIDYSLDEKNIEIISVKSTTNYIVNTSETNYDGHGINSLNNIEMRIQAGSNLYLYTVHGHTAKADGDFKIIGPGNIYLSSGHDAIHCHNFTTTNSGTFTGTFTVTNAISQAIEASETDKEGTANITGGTFVINNSESVIKADYAVNITAGSLTSEGIWSDPFVRGANRTLYVNITDGVSVIINGETFTTYEV